MVFHTYRARSAVVIVLFFMTISFSPATVGDTSLIQNQWRPEGINPTLHIDHLSTSEVYPGDILTIFGTGFGSTAGYVVFTGLKIQADSWSDTQIVITTPESGASGFLYVRDATNTQSNRVTISVKRTMPAGQFEPYGFQMTDVGQLGAAYLVETDGSYFYGITGFETLCTYKILGDGSHTLCNRMYLPQRVGDLKLWNGYLFITGDHGLVVYRCSDLQNNTPQVIAAVAGGSFITCDIREKNGSPIQGTLLALCEYLPVWGTNVERIPLYRFEGEELELVGCYTRTVDTLERQHAIAIDPLNPKLYVSGFKTFLGSDKYILELDISTPESIQLNYRMETGTILAFDMDARDDVLWTGVVSTGTVRFQVYDLHVGALHLTLAQTVSGPYMIGRATRVKIVDDTMTVGCSWSGERPDVYLLDTFTSGTQPLATANSIDWAFDVTGYAFQAGKGKIIVADEWGGFLTYNYTDTPSDLISHVQNYYWVVSGAMTQEIYVTDDRLFVADRGAGVLSADRDALSDESSWRSVPWTWTDPTPQPHPISALATREDSTYGTLIAALGHDKAMAWGAKVYGILYKETDDAIEFLAISDVVDPPGLYSNGFSVIWPEPDLVYMLTGTDGFRAYVVNPDEPSIRLHADCVTQGFGTDSFSTSNAARYMVSYNQKLLIGSEPGFLVSDPTFHVYDVSYPDGVPDRDHPDRHIVVTKEIELNCTKHKPVYHIDVTSSGLVALTTSQGVAVFDISWIPQLNALSDTVAWNLIRIPDETYEPWWDDSWGSEQADARFADDSTLYVVKSPYGIWRIEVDLDASHYTHNSRPVGFYPGVQCGINYSQFLSGWRNPDIVTLHHPYGLVVDNGDIYVHGWSGKVNAFSFTATNAPPSKPSITGPANGHQNTEYDYTVSSTDPEGQHLFYYIDWGDGTTDKWVGPYNSGEAATIGHTWIKKGTYQITAKVQDENHGVSYWGQYQVTMPNSYIIDHPLLQFMLERILNFFSFIKSLIQAMPGRFVSLSEGYFLN